MLERTREAGVSLAWVTGDCIYGDSRTLRGWLEKHKQAYVLAVSGKERVWRAQRQQSVKALLAELPSEGWERLSAGSGSKGPRWYDWLRLELAAPRQVGWTRWLLVRRTCSDPTKVTASVAFAPAEKTLVEHVRVAGMRWTVEESLQTAKGEVGLDHYEVRSWVGWYPSAGTLAPNKR
jgi:SRSO17 transposase